MDPKIKLGYLVAPLGRHMKSKGETLQLLHAIHFPNSEVTEKMVAPAAANQDKCFHWLVAVRLVTYRRVEWANYSFATSRNG
jgi:hypothetical protein